MKGPTKKANQLLLELQALHQRIDELESRQGKVLPTMETLQETEQRLHSIIGGSPIPAFVIGKDHRLIYWNRALEELSKIRADEVIGTRQHWRAFYSRQRPCMADLLVDQALEAVPLWYRDKYRKSKLLDEAYEATDFFPELGKEGKWLRFTAAVIRNTAGELVGAIETLEDITERQQAEQALLKAHEELETRVRERTIALAKANEALQAELAERRRAETALKQTTDHLSLILESLPIVPFTCRADKKFTITFVSSAVEEITGYPPQEFMEKPAFWLDHIHPEDRQKMLTRLGREIAKGAYRCEYRFRVADGSYRWFADFRRLVKHPDGDTNYIVGTWQDVTEDKHLRQEADLRLQQIIQTHKLAALGEVVAGVAHEINNPVSFIAYNIPLLEEIWHSLERTLASYGIIHRDWSSRGMSYAEISQNMQDIIHAFKTATSRINRVMTSLKEFSRSDETVQKRPVQINEVVHGALTIVGAQIRKTVSQIDQHLAEDLPQIPAHFQKIEQVVTNLLINAHQAVPPGRKGRIRIATRYIPRLEAIVIEIEDNGRGMERDVLDHIFDPFFTTRRDTGGTGLGLSISYGLIQEHQGTIGILSRPGKGSRFAIFLPADGEGMIKILPAILCVDHDPGFLQELGTYFVDAHEWLSGPDDTPEKILACLEDHPEVDLVIAAIQLPAMNAGELMGRIRERFPLLAVVLYSSNTAALRAMHRSTAPADLLLQKPFSMEQLQKFIFETGRQRL